MKVKELIAQLQDADPEAEVRFMQIAADSTESDSIDEIDIQTEPWTFEQGKDYSVNYSGEPEPRGAGYEEVTYERLSVVLLKPDMPPSWKALLEKS